MFSRCILRLGKPHFYCTMSTQLFMYLWSMLSFYQYKNQSEIKPIFPHWPINNFPSCDSRRAARRTLPRPSRGGTTGPVTSARLTTAWKQAAGRLTFHFWSFRWNLESHWLVFKPSCSLVSQGSSQAETLSHNLHNGQKAPPKSTKSTPAKKQPEAAADISKSSRPAGDRRWVELLVCVHCPIQSSVWTSETNNDLFGAFILRYCCLGFPIQRLSL